MGAIRTIKQVIKFAGFLKTMNKRRRAVKDIKAAIAAGRGEVPKAGKRLKGKAGASIAKASLSEAGSSLTADSGMEQSRRTSPGRLLMRTKTGRKMTSTVLMRMAKACVRTLR